MRQFLIIFAAVFFHGTAIQGQTSALMQEEMFCDYLGIFAKQIARNKVRGLPFHALMNLIISTASGVLFYLIPRRKFTSWTRKFCARHWTSFQERN